jgi:hypothetical protein
MGDGASGDDGLAHRPDWRVLIVGRGGGERRGAGIGWDAIGRLGDERLERSSWRGGGAEDVGEQLWAAGDSGTVETGPLCADGFRLKVGKPNIDVRFFSLGEMTPPSPPSDALVGAISGLAGAVNIPPRVMVLYALSILGLGCTDSST